MDNIHIFHYADMKRDLPVAVAGFAKALGIAVNDEDIAQISRIADFENMRGNAEQFAPNAARDRWKDNQKFFNKGSSGQWKEALGEADMARYDARISALLTPEQIAWIHNGEGGGDGSSEGGGAAA